MKKYFLNLLSLLIIILITLNFLVGCVYNTNDTTLFKDSISKLKNESSNAIVNNFGNVEETQVSSEIDQLDLNKKSVSKNENSLLNINESETCESECINEIVFSIEPTGNYIEGEILVKTADMKEELFGTLKYLSYKQLYLNSKWYVIKLDPSISSVDAVKYLYYLNTFDEVDYNYVMTADGEVESIDISGNDYEPNPSYFKPMEIKEAWKNLQNEGINSGGDPNVIVAVIDTGVDYNHVDLRNNIWRNTGEIPDNGIDDDGNGYIDDVYGWDFVGNDNDPMDDNGHGTHVAGIIAAENNKIGTVGMAYNCKVMCLKAGNSSGNFNNDSIAEAIQYAYMNGASVINMSFGGASISLTVGDELRNAYNSCVLVAAAGNSCLCNNIAHTLLHNVGVIYPASLSYVIGVMSVSSDGSTVSSFSNYDDTPYNIVEYEVYACGESISSTWPNNKYARLSGTSMSCPAVSSIAALLRSKYMDRDLYPTKYIQSQIINTGILKAKKPDIARIVHIMKQEMLMHLTMISQQNGQ